MEGFCTRCGDCCENIYYGKTPEEVAEQLESYEYHEPDHFNTASLRLITDHWTHKGDGRYSCDMLDEKTRLCTHPDRPYICSGYPHYDREPEDPEDQRIMSKRCGFWLDYKPEQRPKNFLPVIG